MAKKLPQDISSLSKDANAVTRKLKEARTKMANCPQCCVEASCSHRTAVKLWIFQALLTDFSSNLAFIGILGAFGVPFVQGPPASLFRVAKGAELH